MAVLLSLSNGKDLMLSEKSGERGDELDKEIVYRGYHSKVYGYILSKIGNPHDAEDIAADVFVKIYAKLDTFDENKALEKLRNKL